MGDKGNIFLTEAEAIAEEIRLLEERVSGLNARLSSLTTEAGRFLSPQSVAHQSLNTLPSPPLSLRSDSSRIIHDSVGSLLEDDQDERSVSLQRCYTLPLTDEPPTDRLNTKNLTRTSIHYQTSRNLILRIITGNPLRGRSP